MKPQSIQNTDFDQGKEGSRKAEITNGDKKYKGTVDKVSRIAIPIVLGNTLIVFMGQCTY